MRTILKFPFAIHPSTEVMMPKGAQLLLVGQQDNPSELCFWAEVECGEGPSLEGVEMERWELAVIGTGFRMRYEYLKHLGSVIAAPFVWHVYRRGEY